jgi:hypothetical protein|tara:strand:- start:3763 stop:4371 length:609 start_codon:yes stop_codon:yes gene_type:complete
MKIEKFQEPWEHFTIGNFFQTQHYELIKQLPPLKTDYSDITGFRDVLKGRVFLSDSYVKQNPQFEPVADFLNNKILIGGLFGVDLTNALCRPEIIDDRHPFFHEVHTDEPNKKLTIIVNIDKEDNQNLATDLYKDKETHAKKLDWQDNSAVLFVPTDEMWHGFAPMEYKGIRRIMIINFVDENVWRDKDQCYVGKNSQPVYR